MSVELKIPYSLLEHEKFPRQAKKYRTVLRKKLKTN